MKKAIFIILGVMLILGFNMISISCTTNEKPSVTSYSITVVNGSGTGVYEAGTSVTVTAENKEGYDFTAWKVDGNVVSTEKSYTFIVSKNAVITAFYKTDNGINVVLLIGGKAAAGQATSFDLSQADRETYNKYENGFANTYIYYQNYETATKRHSYNEEFEKVQLGAGYDANRFGAEMGIAEALSKQSGKHYIIKYTNADGSLFDTFRSPSSGGKTGTGYKNLKEFIAGGLKKLTDSGFEPDVKACVIMQGDEDNDYSWQYYSLLSNFVSDLRNDLKSVSSNNLPVIDLAVNDEVNGSHEIINASKNTLSSYGVTEYVDLNDDTSYVGGNYTAVSMTTIGETLGEKVVEAMDKTQADNSAFTYTSNTDLVLDNNVGGSVSQSRWNFEYLDNGLKIVAEVRDDSPYSNSGTFWYNDNVEFYIQAGGSPKIREKFSIKVLLSTDGYITLQYLANGQNLDVVMGRDVYYNVQLVDGGYRAVCYLAYEVMNTDYVSAVGRVHFCPCSINAITENTRNWASVATTDLNVYYDDPMSWYTLIADGTVERGAGSHNAFDLENAYKQSGNYKGGLISEQLATVMPNDRLTTIIEVQDGVSVFNEHVYGLDVNGTPEVLFGKSLIHGEIKGSNCIVTEAGFVVMSIPNEDDGGRYYTLNEKLIWDGWECIGVNQLNVVVSTYQNYLNNYYIKWCEEGEIICYDTYDCYYFVFGETLTDTSAYHVDDWVNLNTQISTDTAISLSYGQTYGALPTFKCTDGGRLYTVFMSGDSDPGCQHKLILAVSDDGGKNWIYLGTIEGKDGYCYPADPQVTKDSRNRIWIFFPQEAYLANLVASQQTCYIRIDNPDAPIEDITLGEIHTTGMNLVVRGFTEVNNNGTNEIVVMGTSYADNYNCYTYYSSDDGTTWKRGGNIAASGASQHDEVTCVTLSDNTIMAYIRPRQGITKTLESYSYDCGRTWTYAKATKWDNPNARVYLYKTKNGTIIFARNNSVTSREKMTVYASRDDGKTWSSGLLLMSQSGVSYPDIAEAPNGDIYVTFDYDRSGRGQLFVAKMTIAEIMAGGTINPQNIWDISSIRINLTLRDITGTVIKKDGTPIKNASVKLFTKTGGEVKSVDTAADGTFTLQSVNLDSFSYAVISNGTYSKKIDNLSYILFTQRLTGCDLGEIALYDADYSAYTPLGMFGGYQGMSIYDGYITRDGDSIDFKFVSSNAKTGDVISVYLQQDGMNTTRKNEQTVIVKLYADKVEFCNYVNGNYIPFMTMSFTEAAAVGVNVSRITDGAVTKYDLIVSYEAITAVYRHIGCTVAPTQSSIIPFALRLTSVNRYGRVESCSWIAPEIESTDWDVQVVNPDIPYDYAVVLADGTVSSMKTIMREASLTALSSGAEACAYSSSKMIAITLKVKKNSLSDNTTVYIFLGDNRVTESAVSFTLMNTGNFAWKSGRTNGTWTMWRDGSWSRKNLRGFRDYIDNAKWQSAGDYVYHYLYIDASIFGLDGIPDNVYVSVGGNGTSGTALAVKKIGG